MSAQFPHEPVAAPNAPERPGDPRGPQEPGSSESAFWGPEEEHSRATRGKQQRKRRRRRILLAILVFIVLVVLGLAGLIWQRQASYNSNIARLPGAMPTGKRPGPNVTGTQNWLLVGSDTRVESATTGNGGGDKLWKPGAQRSDTLMLLHLPAKRNKAYIVSFPRDSWVDVPGYDTQKINAAFSYGGPPLLIETVENLTGIRIDHFGAIDFNGFKSMTDALGGVDVEIAQTVSDPMNNKTWQAGRNHLNGEDALKFVRQRHGLPNGDFDRIKRQQAFLKAVTQKAADGGTITNPFKLDGFMSAFTKTISVDDSVSGGKLRSLALSLRGLRGSDISFLTVPNKGSAARGKQSVVLLDDAKAKELYDAVRGAQVSDYVQRHGGTNSVGTVS